MGRATTRSAPPSALMMARCCVADPSLESRFGDLVPVLLRGGVDGVELCHYHLDAPRVAQALSVKR